MGWVTVLEVWSIIIVVGHGGLQADMMLELRVLYLERQATGSELSHWVWLKYI